MQATAALEVGQLAPEFKLKGPGGQFVTLSEFHGHQNVVLVFFPLAFSRVCSHQLPAIEKLMPRYAALGAAVFGVSVDSHYANTEFAKQLKLSFPLLSDLKRETSVAYGVYLPEFAYSQRATFVIDREGRVAHRDISADMGDLEQVPSNDRVLAVLESLQ